MNAFELANIEALAVLLPEATVTELTTAAIRKWNCARSDIVGRQLVKYGTGTISARYLAATAGRAVSRCGGDLCTAPGRPESLLLQAAAMERWHPETS